MTEDNPYVNVIPPQYVSVLLKIHSKLDGKGVWWALCGDLAEALGAVRVSPSCVEIVTSKEGAEQIYQAVLDFSPDPISLRIEQLPRKAVVNGAEYSVSVRSYGFEFKVDSTPVKVYGNLQYRLDDWEWGDKFEFDPRVVYIVNKPTNVEPINVALDLYQALGWVDRVDKIRWVLETRKLAPRPLRR